MVCEASKQASSRMAQSQKDMANDNAGAGERRRVRREVDRLVEGLPLSQGDRQRPIEAVARPCRIDGVDDGRRNRPDATVVDYEGTPLSPFHDHCTHALRA